MTATNTLIDYDHIDSALPDGVEIYNGYSGRGMLYGRECFGVSHRTLAELLQFFTNLAQQGELDPILERLTRCAQQDDLGLDTITYFPGYELEGER